MKKTLIYRIPLVILIFVFSSLLALFVLIPKSIVLDRLLMDRGVVLISERVRESLFGIRFERVLLFFNGELEANPDLLALELKPTALILSARCGKGYLRGSVSLSGDALLRAKSFGCLKRARNVDGELKLEGDRLLGRLFLEGVDAGGFSIDRISLLFKGRKFDGEVDYGKIKLTGGGDIKLKPGKLDDSEINAVFRGIMGSLVIRGKLGNLSVQFRQ